MRAQFALVPLATLAIVVPAHAVVYLSVEQAQSNMFPGATFTPEFKSLSKEQAAAIEEGFGFGSAQSRPEGLARIDGRLVHRRPGRRQT
jgi:hypothetical protein